MFRIFTRVKVHSGRLNNFKAVTKNLMCYSFGIG